MKPHKARAAFFRLLHRRAQRFGRDYVTKGKLRKALRLVAEGKSLELLDRIEAP